MSGGLAFVYDPEKRLKDLCNEDVAGDLLQITEMEVSYCSLLPHLTWMMAWALYQAHALKPLLELLCSDPMAL
jgi:hypothetical protein